MDSATTTAAGEKPIIFQAMASDDETMVLRNIWLIITPTPQKGIFETFNDVQPPKDKERLGTALLGTSSIFVKSSLYAVGGRKPNSDELGSCIRYLDTSKPSEGWKVGTLPSSSFDSVFGVYGDFLYILPGMWKYGYYDMDEDTYRTEQRVYVWDTIKNERLPTNILPPEDGGQRQWRRIRACASLDNEGLLIAMDGEKNNFFLYNPENKDWKPYYIEDPLPKFIGETSFAASKGRLYILEVRGKSPPFLYIYEIKNGKGKLVMDKKPIPKFDDDLWSMDEWDREVRLVPVADDKLCFLWLGPVFYENENMWPPVRILHYLKVKFSIDPKLEVNVEDDKGFRTYITNLLDCLPCDPEQFGADVEDRAPLYFQLLISGEPFLDQAEDIASPKEKGKGKRKRTQLVDPSSRREQKRAKAALPNPEMSSTFVTDVSEQGFPHNPVTAFAPATPGATCSFQKVLSEIDIGKGVAVKSSFMEHLPDSSGRGTINFPVRDVASGKMYEFAYYIRRVGHPKPVFQGGWRDYCRDRGLQAGDRITFSENRGSYTILAERKMNKELFGHEAWEWIQ